jgi:hypothetical protein
MLRFVTRPIPIVLLVAAACLASGSVLQSQQKPGVSEFEGKYLGVGFKGEKAYEYLEKCQVRRLGEHSFLVGTFVDVGYTNWEKWRVGQTIWISISDISYIHVFPTLEAMKAGKVAIEKDAAAVEKDAKTKPK